MNINRLISEIEYLKKKEEAKQDTYFKLYNKAYHDYNSNENLLQVKIIPIWRKLVKTKHRINAFNEILNIIILFDKGKINYEVCDTMINCDECDNCTFKSEYVQNFKKNMKK